MANTFRKVFYQITISGLIVLKLIKVKPNFFHKKVTQRLIKLNSFLMVARVINRFFKSSFFRVKLHSVNRVFLSLDRRYKLSAIFEIRIRSNIKELGEILIFPELLSGDAVIMPIEKSILLLNPVGESLIDVLVHAIGLQDFDPMILVKIVKPHLNYLRLAGHSHRDLLHPLARAPHLIIAYFCGDYLQGNIHFCSFLQPC